MNEPAPNAASKDPANQALSDELLMGLYLAKSDRQALETLIERYKDFAFHVAWAAGCGKQLAEEAAQEAFAVLIGKKLRFTDRGQGSFRKWFCSVAINVIRHCRRGEQRLRNREHQLQRQTELERGRELPGAADMQVEEDETRRIMQQALFALQPELRLPITLHYYEGVSVNDIGRTLDLDAKTVRNRMAAGLDKIRRQLARQGITAAPAAIPALLANAPLPPAPATLGATLRHLAANLGQPTGLPATSTNSARAAGLSGWTWAMAGLLLCAAVAGGAAYWQANRTPRNNGDGALLPGTVNPQTEKFHRLWNFNENSTADLPSALGAWRWERGRDGIGRLVVDEENTPVRSTTLPRRDGKAADIQYKLAAFVLPQKTPAKPFCLIVKGAEIAQSKFYTQRAENKIVDLLYGFSAGWADEQNAPLPNEMVSNVLIWRDDKSSNGLMNRKFIFMGKWVLSYLDGDGRLSAQRYEKEYPSDKVSCWFWNYGVERMELREAAPEEVRIALQHIERLEQQESAAEKK